MKAGNQDSHNDERKKLRIRPLAVHIVGGNITVLAKVMRRKRLISFGILYYTVQHHQPQARESYHKREQARDA